MKTITRIRNNKSSLAVVLLLVATSIAVYALQMNQDNRSKASGNFTATSGRPFADNSAWNQPIGSNVQIDPNSAAIVAKLASGKQGASLYDFGTPIFFADASTPKYNIDCTQDWGNCGLEAEPVPIPDDAQQAPGSDAQMVIVDLAGRKSYEFWIYNNDKASANWGAILPLDGDGRGAPDNSAIGAGTSRLAGIIRTYEIEQGIIDHALVFSTKFCQGPTNSSNFRYPATKTDGKYEGTGAIPEGARVQLDPSIDVNSIDGISKGEKAVAVALQKYGAYAVDCGGAEMAIQFENPIGKNDPYPSAGLTHDYFEFDKIPWNKLRVLESWNSYTPAANVPPATNTIRPTFPSPKIITPTLYCLGSCPTNPPSDPDNPPSDGDPIPPPADDDTDPGDGNPCTDAQSTVQNADGQVVAQYDKERPRSRGGFFQRFFQMLFDFIYRLIELLLGGVPGAPENPNLPDNPNPGQPTPCPEPTDQTQPTQAPIPTTGTQPTTIPSPTLFSEPTTEPPAPITGELLWQDAPASPIGTQAVSDSQWLENWYPAAYNIKYGGSISIVSDPVKGKAIEFFGKGGEHGDDGYNPYQRAELVPALNLGGGDSSLAIGKTYWFGFDLWVGSDVGISSNHSLIWQIKQDPDAGSPNVEFSLQRHQEGLHLLTADGGNHPLGPVPVESWTRFVIGANVTKGSDSWIEIYRDGQLVLPRTNINAGMVTSDAKWAYMKTGIYHGPQAWDLRVRMANYKIGTTKAIVQ